MRDVLDSRTSSSSPTRATASTSAMAENSGFFASTDVVSGTTMHRCATSASRSPIAFGEKSPSRLTTDPGVTMLFSRRRIHSRTVSLNHRNEKARSRQMMASAVRWPSKTSSRNSIGTYRPPNNRCCPVMKPLSGLK